VHAVKAGNKQSSTQNAAKVHDLSQKEGGAEYGEDEAERVRHRQEHRAFQLHAPRLEIMGQSRHHETLLVGSSMHQQIIINKDIIYMDEIDK
jgi:hypothetical protein